MTTIGIIGCGAMGAGIAQLALQNGHRVVLFDQSLQAVKQAIQSIDGQLKKLIEKGRLSESQWTDCMGRLLQAEQLHDLQSSNLVIEAIIEDLSIKQNLFKQLEKHLSETCILASNTSSLSIAALSSVLTAPQRFLGLHFFNPATVMPLVEVIPGVRTSKESTVWIYNLMKDWKKEPVLAKDTPGFIVNRIARPYYSEALRIAEEGIADFATIDWAMKSQGQFKMGPFELMDFIGHDVNYRVTETVWKELFFDPRFKPSITQKRWFEAGLYGKKTGRGCYQYNSAASMPEPTKNTELAAVIFNRILSMLINEAADALYYQIATREDIETAMKKGVNYPKGLLEWGNQFGLQLVKETLHKLYHRYQEERYRLSPKIEDCIQANQLL